MSFTPYQSRPPLPAEALADDLPAGAAAAQYAGAGWKVLLLTWPSWTTDQLTGERVLLCSCSRRAGDGPGFCPSPGKHPFARAMPHGLLDATTDAPALAALFRRFPRANLGIRTGSRPEGSDLVVLDVDVAKGGAETLHQLEQEERRLPATVECLTGGGGRHLYFLAGGARVRSSVGHLGPGLDVRAEGGYCVLPPSRHASGSKYAWEWSSHPAQLPPAPLPAWLERRLLAPSPTRAMDGPATPWVPRLLRDGAPQGERNDSAFRLACYLRHYGLPAAVIGALLAGFAARCRPPLDEAELQQVVRQACRRYAPGIVVEAWDRTEGVGA